MSKTKAKGNGMTLRQRLRDDADKQLTRLVSMSMEAVEDVLDGTPLIAVDIMHLASAKQNKTLRSHLVGALANAKEQELERLYNKQMDMLQEDK